MRKRRRYKYNNGIDMTKKKRILVYIIRLSLTKDDWIEKENTGCYLNYFFSINLLSLVLFH